MYVSKKAAGNKDYDKRTNKADVLDRLEELNCDPLEFNAKIVRGDYIYGEHPFLRKIRSFVKRYVDGKLSSREALNFLSRAEAALGDTPAPMELRSKVAGDLMQYAYAKKKSVEVSGGLDLNKRNPDDLSDAELASIASGVIEGEFEEAEIVPELVEMEKEAEIIPVVIAPSWLKNKSKRDGGTK